jgi:hypothetical protein
MLFIQALIIYELICYVLESIEYQKVFCLSKSTGKPVISINDLGTKNDEFVEIKNAKETENVFFGFQCLENVTPEKYDKLVNYLQDIEPERIFMCHKKWCSIINILTSNRLFIFYPPFQRYVYSVPVSSNSKIFFIVFCSLFHYFFF